METWRWIPGYEDYYQISDLGNVRSVTRRVGRRLLRGGPLRPGRSGSGYLQVSLCRDGKAKQFDIHRLVLRAFDGEPSEGMQACHKNGDQLDNRYVNLRWDTPSANNLDQVIHGTHHLAWKAHCIRGHLLSGPNLMRRGTGRSCRACNSARGKIRHHNLPKEYLQDISDDYYKEYMKEGSLC